MSRLSPRIFQGRYTYIYQFCVEKQTQSLIMILFEQAYEYGLSILVLLEVIGGNGTQTFYSNIWAWDAKYDLSLIHPACWCLLYELWSLGVYIDCIYFSYCLAYPSIACLQVLRTNTQVWSVLYSTHVHMIYHYIIYIYILSYCSFFPAPHHMCNICHNIWMSYMYPTISQEYLFLCPLDQRAFYSKWMATVGHCYSLE